MEAKEIRSRETSWRSVEITQVETPDKIIGGGSKYWARAQEFSR